MGGRSPLSRLGPGPGPHHNHSQATKGQNLPVWTTATPYSAQSLSMRTHVDVGVDPAPPRPFIRLKPLFLICVDSNRIVKSLLIFHTSQSNALPPLVRVCAAVRVRLWRYLIVQVVVRVELIPLWQVAPVSNIRDINRDPVHLALQRGFDGVFEGSQLRCYVEDIMTCDSID